MGTSSLLSSLGLPCLHWQSLVMLCTSISGVVLEHWLFCKLMQHNMGDPLCAPFRCSIPPWTGQLLKRKLIACCTLCLVVVDVLRGVMTSDECVANEQD